MPAFWKLHIANFNWICNAISIVFHWPNKLLSIKTYGSFLLGSPFPCLLWFVVNIALLASRQLKQLLSPEEISPEATRSTARVLSYLFALHDLGSANQGDFFRVCTSLNHGLPSAVFTHFSTKISLFRWCKHWLCAEARFREQKW